MVVQSVKREQCKHARNRAPHWGLSMFLERVQFYCVNTSNLCSASQIKSCSYR